MKFLVLGCNGMAGHLISLYLKEQGHSVVGFAREKSKFVDTIVGDVMEPGTIDNIVKSNEFDVIVNAIGILNQFAEENKAKAVYLNAYLPHYLADITAGTQTRVIHISTDCVFSGEKGQYRENDLKDGKTIYDRSKALGELVDEKNLTLRQSIVGPDIKKAGIGLINWFLQQSGEIQGYQKAMWTGLTTLELAKVIETAARDKIHGLFNMVPDTAISKYDLLELFNIYLRKDKVIILPTNKVIIDKSLVRCNKDFDYEIPDYEIMVKELGEWMEKHKDIYPHYKL